MRLIVTAASSVGVTRKPLAKKLLTQMSESLNLLAENILESETRGREQPLLGNCKKNAPLSGRPPYFDATLDAFTHPMTHDAGPVPTEPASLNVVVHSPMLPWEDPAIVSRLGDS